MKKTILIFTLLLAPFLIHSQCNNLVSGNYVVKYDNNYKESSQNFELNIDGVKATQKFLKGTKKSEIKWISGTQFKLVGSGKKMKKSLKNKQKEMKTLGEPFYQITRCKSDTISFVYKINPSILINSGKIIRETNNLIAKRN
ncbi:MAG: hypothetical protein L3J08_04310 [Flavobacteriaceae bacterium]|nr:hypothetical protein [Flavobacteriaceae bacterium]